MGRLVIPLVAAVWLVVAVAVVLTRLRNPRRIGGRRWHRALATVSRWPTSSVEVVPATTWCRTLASEVAGMPQQRLGEAVPAGSLDPADPAAVDGSAHRR